MNYLLSNCPQLNALDLTEDKSTLVQVMAWCCQATSHYLSQCWPRSVSPYMASLGHNELKLCQVEHNNSWISWYFIGLIWQAMTMEMAWRTLRQSGHPCLHNRIQWEYNGLRGENRGPFKGQQVSASNPVMCTVLWNVYNMCTTHHCNH